MPYPPPNPSSARISLGRAVLAAIAALLLLAAAMFLDFWPSDKIPRVSFERNAFATTSTPTPADQYAPVHPPPLPTQTPYNSPLYWEIHWVHTPTPTPTATPTPSPTPTP